jgi:histidinol dehydrogenase
MVTTDEDMIAKVEAEVAEQLKLLPRKTIAQQSIANSKLIFLADKAEAAEFINQYGPEHYILCSRDEAYFLGTLRNAGSVFVGPYTPESAGDYASGTNHTLPTQGYAKQYNGVNLDSFLKSITFQKITDIGLRNIGPTIEVMAEAEGLIGHKNAVSLRLEQLKNNKNSS